MRRSLERPADRVVSVDPPSTSKTKIGGPSDGEYGLLWWIIGKPKQAGYTLLGWAGNSPSCGRNREQ